jgi:hypothetical protein
MNVIHLFITALNILIIVVISKFLPVMSISEFYLKLVLLVALSLVSFLKLFHCLYHFYWKPDILCIVKMRYLFVLLISNMENWISLVRK